MGRFDSSTSSGPLENPSSDTSSDTPLDPSTDNSEPTATQPDGAPTEDTAVDEGKDTTPAAPEAAGPDSSGTPAPAADPVVVTATDNPSDPESHEVTTPLSQRTQDLGVQTGGLTYTKGKDQNGLEVREYPEQDKDVDVIEDPAPAESAS